MSRTKQHISQRRKPAAKDAVTLAVVTSFFAQWEQLFLSVHDRLHEVDLHNTDALLSSLSPLSYLQSLRTRYVSCTELEIRVLALQRLMVPSAEVLAFLREQNIESEGFLQELDRKTQGAYNVDEDKV